MRYYREKYPEVDDLVMVQVRSIAEMGAYVQLLEYDNIEGMILLSELSRRRIRSIQKLIRVGRNEVVVVLRVDKEKGYIDLSKRRVSAEDVLKCEERYNKSKTVHSIMRNVGEKLRMDMEELYEKIVWPLGEKYGHPYDAFKLAVTEADLVFEGIDAPEAILAEVKANISRRLTPQPVKIRADVEVTCFGYDGIDAIKKSLKAGEALSTTEIPIKVKLVAPPLYVLITNSTDKLGGVDALDKAIGVIGETITAEGGEINVKMRPKAVSESEDMELAALMAKAGQENAEVSGDEDEESGEE